MRTEMDLNEFEIDLNTFCEHFFNLDRSENTEIKLSMHVPLGLGNIPGSFLRSIEVE